MLSVWIEPSALNRSVIVEMLFLLPVSATRYFLLYACVLIYAIFQILICTETGLHLESKWLWLQIINAGFFVRPSLLSVFFSTNIITGKMVIKVSLYRYTGSVFRFHQNKLISCSISDLSMSEHPENCPHPCGLQQCIVAVCLSWRLTNKNLFVAASSQVNITFWLNGTTEKGSIQHTDHKSCWN